MAPALPPPPPHDERLSVPIHIELLLLSRFREVALLEPNNTDAFDEREELDGSIEPMSILKFVSKFHTLSLRPQPEEAVLSKF